MKDTEETLLRRAIELAREAREEHGNPPFGSLLADADGKILAEDRNTSLTDNDITAHPELKLARWAAQNLDPETAAATTMFTSTQPCGMCTGAIERSGLGRVVYALSTEQFLTLRPPVTWGYESEGPALFDEARVPVEGYYR
ncbi:cytidine/deoxycytidine deaminase [Amycolatopsis mediterranei S699]|uniref:Cytidine/deoxycytidine deaminase n=2 Tax=Amycolatopsis mediterranei TaxID=33910 RepID=A0A0H3DFH1_AMYMU|nr:nucleoside deaminase [Amycolatopsis mediterranei]ADJ49451.1 cytidine/deoxycytidine deaminase [Amycolatopsis mediterranei U32]AEK46423.1 cytidine/deoxycytidine deaminase [Amycolatopsis mediterranei S699]AFO81159.1 cytidine/deoxycytidine deaminase [Amycolatopsis mediterranei S699]AGT88287.1 cytidine/deoxycytidine deaminase [Amycolatopsis mediterranei RB]KDO12735.1 cytidine deaminase [Amycolatopsis mediterranei]